MEDAKLSRRVAAALGRGDDANPMLEAWIDQNILGGAHLPSIHRLFKALEDAGQDRAVKMLIERALTAQLASKFDTRGAVELNWGGLSDLVGDLVRLGYLNEAQGL